MHTFVTSNPTLSISFFEAAALTQCWHGRLGECVGMAAPTAALGRQDGSPSGSGARPAGGLLLTELEREGALTWRKCLVQLRPGGKGRMGATLLCLCSARVAQ